MKLCLNVLCEQTREYLGRQFWDHYVGYFLRTVNLQMKFMISTYKRRKNAEGSLPTDKEWLPLLYLLFYLFKCHRVIPSGLLQSRPHKISLSRRQTATCQFSFDMSQSMQMLMCMWMRFQSITTEISKVWIVFCFDRMV